MDSKGEFEQSAQLLLKSLLKKYWRLAKTCLIFSDRKAFLVWDNASIHKSAKVKEFIRGTEIKMLTICPYRLSLNPIEKLILFIKSKIKQDGGRYD